MPITVAIVEDNTALCATLQRAVVDSGRYQCVCTSHNAEHALKSIPQHKPDVVIMDIQLPDISGIECVTQLKAIVPDTQFLMLTVYNDNDLIFKALAAGASGYFLKRAAASEIL